MKSNGSGVKKNRLKMTFSGWGFSWEGLITNKNGEWLLVAQLMIISAHLLNPLRFNIQLSSIASLGLNFIAFISICVGIYIIIISVFELGVSLSPLPKPKTNAKLIITNIYRFCRHPLYLGLIQISIGINFLLQSYLHLLLLVLLCIVLIKKAKLEEKYLIVSQEAYESYMRSTPAIIKGLMFFDWRE